MTDIRLGVDIGGTFTDIVALNADGVLYTKKILSTPVDYSQAIQDGFQSLMAEAGLKASSVTEFAHGTTVATNAIIERRGVKVALVVTKGFRDVLELGRFRSPRLYDLGFRKPEPLVERRLRFEVEERVGSNGEVITPLNLRSLDEIAVALKVEKVDAVAICFINSHVNSDHETAAVKHLARLLPGVTLSASTQLLPQIQEYERTSTTVVNSYIRPVVEGYIGSLGRRLNSIGIKAPLMIMQSNGGLLPGDLAGKNPVYIIESGPAAGIVGAQRLGAKVGLRDMIILDMGGTTAKAAIIENGHFNLTQETEVGGGAALGMRLIQGAGYPVQVPTIDMAEVGAGGGSIATVDNAGGLRVGPSSAGAEPGPVCYGRGGANLTVTDANLLLGYLNPNVLVGGDLAIDYNKTDQAMDALGKSINLSRTDLAYGIHLIANANMMQALKTVSSERGYDPSRFTLLAIGGNGPVHAVGLAEELGITKIVVPPVAGLFSALGLLFSDTEHQMVAAFYRRFNETTPAEINEAAEPLFAEAERLLKVGGFDDPDRRELIFSADMKYVGQMASLPIDISRFPVDEVVLDELKEAFARTHEQVYGYRSDGEGIQFIALRAVGRGLSVQARVPDRVARWRESHVETGSRPAFFGPDTGWVSTRNIQRADLAGKPLDGPLIIEEYDSTTVVRPDWRASLDSWNNIIIERCG
jgi:N-methylhydantoinase A